MKGNLYVLKWDYFSWPMQYVTCWWFVYYI